MATPIAPVRRKKNIKVFPVSSGGLGFEPALGIDPNLAPYQTDPFGVPKPTTQPVSPVLPVMPARYRPQPVTTDMERYMDAVSRAMSGEIKPSDAPVAPSPMEFAIKPPTAFTGPADWNKYSQPYSAGKYVPPAAPVASAAPAFPPTIRAMPPTPQAFTPASQLATDPSTELMLDEIQSRVMRQLQPEIAAQARTIGSIRNQNPARRTVSVDGEQFVVNDGRLPGSYGGSLPETRVGVGRQSNGMTGGGAIGTPLMRGSMPAPAVRPTIASKPMVYGVESTPEQFQQAWRERTGGARAVASSGLRAAPNALGTGLPYIPADMVPGAGAMTPSQLRAAVQAAASAPPAAAVPRPVVPPVAPAPAFAPPIAPVPVHSPANWPAGMQPPPSNVANPFPAGMGAAPAPTTPPSVAATPPAPVAPAGWSTRAKVGTGLGAGVLAAGVYGAMSGGPDAPQVVATTPSGNPVYNIPGAITVTDPSGEVKYKVGRLPPTSDPNVAMARLRSQAIDARRSGKDPGYASRRAQIRQQEYAAENPQEVLDATTRIAMAQAAGRDRGSALGEGAAMSIANQGLVQRQIMTDEQAIMMDQTRTPEERAAARQRYDAAAASMPEIPAGPVEYTPAEIQQQIIGGPVQMPVPRRQAVPQPLPITAVPAAPTAPVGGSVAQTGGTAIGTRPVAPPKTGNITTDANNEAETRRQQAAYDANIAALNRGDIPFRPQDREVLDNQSVTLDQAASYLSQQWGVPVAVASAAVQKYRSRPFAGPVPNFIPGGTASARPVARGNM